jgi:uncharacterized protein (TIGR02001 family)
VTVPAGRRDSRAGTGNAFPSAVVRELLFVATLTSASPAAAQVGSSVSIFSDDRFRGYSLSEGRPVAILDLSYDAPNGLYGAISGSVVATRHDGLQPLGFQLNGGYAKRLSSGFTLDGGLVHSNYSAYSSRRTGRSYTEAYFGVAGKLLSSRIYVSPDYLKPGTWTIYGELDASLPVAKKLHLTGHIGMLAPLDRRGGGEIYRRELDWRLAVARDFGPVTVNVAWTGLRHGHDLYQYRSYGRRTLIFGITYVL